MAQGAVSSPPLYNHFSADMEVEAGDINEGFADDNHSAAVSSDLDEISATLNLAAEEIIGWTNENGMGISASKSSITLFTPWTKQVNAQLNVSIDNAAVPMEKNPRLLGVTLDPLFTFSSHAKNIARKASSRLNIMRALSDSEFGKDKECLLMTFKCFIRSITDYAAPIVYPNYSATSIRRLQLIQNSALRLALGCHKASSFEHLHNEALELPVEDHLKLLSAQFLARALQESHPSHRYVLQDRGRRPMKHTLRSKVLDLVEPYLDANGKVAPGDFHRVKNAIHTDVVADSVSRLSTNRLLAGRPLQIDPSEQRLPRIARSTLSQLRSGFCSCLQSFQFKIGGADNDLCPECMSFPHTPEHLFECASKPTNLTKESLWSNPWAVANFLKTLPSFSFFPDVGPPPPPRRRARRRPPPAPDQFSPTSLPPSPFLFTPPPLTTPLTPTLPPLLSLSYSDISSGDLSSSSSST